jgi:RNA polymerase sigma factor (sigma-70 family)
MDGTYALRASRVFRAAGRPTNDDRLILERVALGDEGALAELYDLHGRALFGYLFNLTRDRQLAEEVLQDTLVAVWRSAKTFRGRSSVKTWLFGVARRRTHDALRRRKLPLAPEGEFEALRDAEPAPEESLLAAASREELADHLGELSPAHREILDLIFFHGLSYAEAAEVLGVPLGTVKSRLSGAKRALRASLEDSEEAR